MHFSFLQFCVIVFVAFTLLPVWLYVMTYMIYAAKYSQMVKYASEALDIYIKMSGANNE